MIIFKPLIYLFLPKKLISRKITKSNVYMQPLVDINRATIVLLN